MQDAKIVSKPLNQRVKDHVKSMKAILQGTIGFYTSTISTLSVITPPTSDEFSGCVQVAPSDQPFFTIEESKWVAKRNPLMNEFLSLNTKHGWSAQPTNEDFT